jgi:hypothetical protein
MQARIAFLGSADSIEAARDWIQSCARGVKGESGQPDFPGCSRDAGFFVDLLFDDSWNAVLSRQDRDTALGTRGSAARFGALLSMFEEKFAWLSGLDLRPDYVLVALPDDILKKGAIVEYPGDGGRVHRDLRRALKAVAMRHRLPTQLLLPKTIEGRNVDDKARCAWNIFTGMYFKLGAIPWAPLGLDDDTCFVGVAFYRPLGSNNSMRASLAQAFNGRGDALIVRGDEFPWTPSDRDRSPHLDAERAGKLVEIVLARYAKETQERTPPRRVVIHKTSRFWPEEVEGFKSAISAAGVSRYDLLALSPSSDIRLLREGNYPVLRGTHFALGNLDYLYTTGYLTYLRAYPHGHVPLPIQIADHHGGDTPVTQLLREIMVLTKLNWNSANFCSRRPVTLESARVVGDILREVPPDQEPAANLKFYV